MPIFGDFPLFAEDAEEAEVTDFFAKVLRAQPGGGKRRLHRVR
ncbi:MAG: hypothetical protein R3F11_13030 [Verrucomicrobiales bacterium]